MPSNNEYDVYGVEIDATGHPLQAPFPIAARLNQQERRPAVAAGDHEFLVAWQSTPMGQPDASSIMTCRIPLSDVVTPSDPAKVANGSSPAVVRQGTDYALAYLDAANQLWLTTLSHPSIRQAMTSVPDPRSNLELAAGSGTLVALYLRNAMELPYLGTSTAFYQFFGQGRRRAAGR